MKRGWIILSVLAIVMSFFCTSGAFAGVPQMINYQGTLTNSSGASVPNGNYSIEFKIYDVASGGTALWTEKWDTTTSQITVVNGSLNAMLGFLTPIPATFFADHPVTYLGIKVGTDSEMLPRQQITSVGYAFTAGNGVPKGGIIMWSGAIADIPAGWALCDGVERTRDDGSKVTPPDLRDRFIMGAGNGYAVASIGGSTTKNLAHVHTYSGATAQSSDTTSITHGENLASYKTHSHTYSGTTASGGNSAQDILPPYYALAFIMKL